MRNDKMTREDLIETINIPMAQIEAHHEALCKLIDALAGVKRGDVSFNAIDAAKEVADGYAETREAILTVRSSLKRRAMARMSEE